jgi:transglutaminase-like putative cysteine protease
MEVRVHPRSENNQHCLDFRLRTTPRAHIMSYRGEFGNRVHHFDIPNSHSQLTIIVESLVDMLAPPVCPEELPASSWDELDALTEQDDYWDTLMPSQFARESPLLAELAHELHVERSADPLTVLRTLNTAIYQTFDYSPRTTRVDSPIDEALQLRKGVCQDFAHIMIALVRQLRIPCRYVSGYLCQQGRGMERVPDSAMHAWVEAYLPGLDWVGFDPTNNTLADERHVRVAIGRDYADVSPTRGVFRGRTESELSVSVSVIPSNTLARELPSEASWTIPGASDEEDEESKIQLAQQQQQQ